MKDLEEEKSNFLKVLHEFDDRLKQSHEWVECGVAFDVKDFVYPCEVSCPFFLLIKI